MRVWNDLLIELLLLMMAVFSYKVRILKFLIMILVFSSFQKKMLSFDGVFSLILNMS